MLNVEKCIYHCNSGEKSKLIENIRGGGIGERPRAHRDACPAGWWTSSNMVWLRELRGSFALLDEQEKSVILGCDIIRSISLFYCVKEHRIWVGDDAAKIAEKSKSVLQDENVNEFLRASYVTENETIFRGIYQVLPGEYVVISKEDGSIFRKSYYECRYTCDGTGVEKEFLEELDACLDEVFCDMIQRLDGRTALIPLSGGCDSRTAAVVLKRLGYKDIVCFSYGRAGNEESECSKEVAEALGCPWHFIEYNGKVWRDFFHSPDYKKYLDFSCRGTSIGSIQPLPAVLELKRRELAVENAVVIPGHALDFLAGSHIHIENREYNRTEMAAMILQDHYNLRTSPTVQKAVRKWVKNIPETLSPRGMVQEYMLWEWKNRQAKFIANDVRAYEFAGLDWELPFWDKRLCDFFSKLPRIFLEGRYLQYQYMQNYIDPTVGIQMDYMDCSMSKKERRKSKLKKIAFLRYLNRVKICLRNYKHTGNAFYDYMSAGDYLKCICKYGWDFNLNTIEAEDYIKLFIK